MYYQGRVANGVVVLEDGRQLPEGTKVTVVPALQPSEESSDDPIYHVADLALPTGVPDLSLNIDHYLYGHPRVNDDHE